MSWRAFTPLVAFLLAGLSGCTGSGGESVSPTPHNSIELQAVRGDATLTGAWSEQTACPALEARNLTIVRCDSTGAKAHGGSSFLTIQVQNGSTFYAETIELSAPQYFARQEDASAAAAREWNIIEPAFNANLTAFENSTGMSTRGEVTWSPVTAVTSS